MQGIKEMKNLPAPLSLQKLEQEQRKGLYEIEAELAESEGEYLEAASLYMQAARYASMHGEPKGLVDYTNHLLAKKKQCEELAMSIILADSPETLWIDE
jgi:hypothetical protein